MQLFASERVSKSKRIYHKPGCIYSKQIKNKLILQIGNKDDRDYCKCSYCAGLKGDIRISQKDFDRWVKSDKIKVICDYKTETIYVSTDIGFWKIFRKTNNRKYVLYHRNEYSKEMSLKEASWGQFHRQADCAANGLIDNLIKYIVAHDRAKVIINDDYHKLPQNTKKEKEYYRRAERKVKKRSIKNLFSIFDRLEKQNPELKYAYREYAY